MNFTVLAVANIQLYVLRTVIIGQVICWLIKVITILVLDLLKDHIISKLFFINIE